jgi:hypothetical protein
MWFLQTRMALFVFQSSPFFRASTSPDSGHRIRVYSKTHPPRSGSAHPARGDSHVHGMMLRVPAEIQYAHFPLHD